MWHYATFLISLGARILDACSFITSSDFLEIYGCFVPSVFVYVKHIIDNCIILLGIDVLLLFFLSK